MHPPLRYTRRDALTILGVASALGAAGVRGHTRQAGYAIEGVVERNDAAVQGLLRAQVTDPASPWRGSAPDQFGLHTAGSAAGIVETLAASFVHPRSRFHDDGALLEGIRLAAGFLERSQSPQGNIDLLTTNFNSPPDTGFVVHGVATAAVIGRLHGRAEIAEILRPFLVKAGGGMAEGGVHTPNHRWVICAALAQIHALFPNARFVTRIDEWLAEGIDIDGDGQYTERSTLTYNVVTDRALVVMAAKLKRPALLDPVRQNLRALAYLLHADGEVVTEISHRQDQYTRGGIQGYWFPLTYLALEDQSGLFSSMARLAADGARLSTLLEYPELSRPLPSPEPLPDDFEKRFPEVGIVRIRRGPLSGTLVLGGSSRVFTLRYGDAVVEGVRFATSFFGKAQFVPDSVEKQGNTYRFRQVLEAPYYQPLGRRITTGTWTMTRPERRQSEVCRLEQSLEITETNGGFRLRVQAAGTNGVPLAVEITFREGGELVGCRPLKDSPGVFLLERTSGMYRSGRNEIRFGPGRASHQYTQLRGAEPRLPGQSAYLTGFTPFDHTLTFDCSQRSNGR
jgi:hypothetical protein